MITLISSAILMLFLVWSHKLLIKCHAPPVETPAKNYTKKLITTILVFLGCYAFVYLTNQYLMPAHSINLFYEKTIKPSQTQDEELDNNNYNNKSADRNNNFFILSTADKINTKFTDIAGLMEVKDEVIDIIKFLQSPKQFERLGAKAPKGVLLSGPPGTGKTLMARAIAGESNVAFIAVAGSQFEEEYVGVGAARIRQLFALARKNAPCIIFIDEIDSLAYKRHSSNNIPWAAQTVNQLLTEMDGLNDTQNEGIIVMAASNRMDVLDPAIMRPGRFDRHLKLDLPTLSERQDILKIYLNKIKSHKDINIKTLAKMSPGFSSAELAHFVNEAAIDATKKDKKYVTMGSFEVAKDRIILGAKRQALIMSEHEREVTAFHEAGHALVGYYLPGHNPIYKITIAPRGMSLGHTSFEPSADEFSYSKQYLENKIASYLGGRAAEELIFGEENVTTGAENDLQQATKLAHNMVTKWGYSKNLGPMYHDPSLDLIPKEKIEQEVKEILQNGYKTAKHILQQHSDKLHLITNQLLDKETIDTEQFKNLMT